MSQTKKEGISSYVTRALVPSEDGNDLHMTLAFHGKYEWGTLGSIRSSFNSILVPLLPFTVVFDGEALFGPEKNIPVRLCHPESKDVEKELVRYYHATNDKTEFAYSEKGPSFHVTIKKEAEAAEVRKMKSFVVDTIDIKQLGGKFIWKASKGSSKINWNVSKEKSESKASKDDK